MGVIKKGKPVALLTGLPDDEEIEPLMLDHNPRLVELLQAARESIRQTGGISESEFWAEARKRRKTKR